MEVVVATTIATVVTAAIVVAAAEHFAFIGRAFEEAVAQRAAAARLEEIGAAAAAGGPLAPGARTFPVPALADGRGEERVRALEPGLLSVEVLVTWTCGREGGERRVALGTLVATEGAP